MTSLASTLTALLDEGSAQTIHVDSRAAQGDYAATLERARQRSGSDESVQVLHATIAGHRVVVIGGDFEFLAGSVGQEAADRVVMGYLHATAERIPVITLPTSGGTRMQEGTAAFFRMVDIARVAGEHLTTGQVRIGWLRNPTTGGVMATWGSYADITAAEPGALLGFLGPRVYEALYNQPFPPAVQTAENLADVGIIDDVVPVSGLRDWMAHILDVTNGVDAPTPATSASEAMPVDAWDAIQCTRADDRPGPQAVLDQLTSVTELRGTQAGEAGGGIRVCLGRWQGRRALVVATTREEVTPSGLRVAQRGLRLADRLRLPVVTLVDTPGGELSREAEEAAMAGEIARTLMLLTSLQTRSVSVIMGQGCGGAALALIPAGTRICMENGWVSPLPPEGASVIMHRSPDRAPDLARQQGVGAFDMLSAGVVDAVVAEGDDVAKAVVNAVVRYL